MEVLQNKLFVGNLPENCDPVKLKQVFSSHIRVTHCDIVKNYAFVHVVDEDTPLIDDIIKKLDGYMYEGKMLNLKKSTSKMRGTIPGQETTCFRCGESSHRTMNCPKNEKTMLPEVVRFDLTGKRSASGVDGPDAKRMCEQPAAIDQELTRPIDAELLPLYNQYSDARNKYIYCKDRLIREQQARNRLVTYTSGQIVPTVGGTALSQQTSTTYASVQPQQATYVQAQPIAVQAVQQAAPYTIVQTAQGQTVLYPTAQIAGQTVVYAQPAATQGVGVAQQTTNMVGQTQTFASLPHTTTPSAPYSMINTQGYAQSTPSANNGNLTGGGSYVGQSQSNYLSSQQAPYGSSIISSISGSSTSQSTPNLQYTSTHSNIQPQAPYQTVSSPWMQSSMSSRN